MKNIIAHRGFWFDIAEQNTQVAFERALSNKFGIETDLRDHDGFVVISHDMPDSQSMSYNEFLTTCSRYDRQLVLALNIKSDGLQALLKQSEIRNSHFYFDMSVPDMLGFHKQQLPTYSRYSDIETVPSLYKESPGIWLDNFRDETLDLDALKRFLIDKKSVVLVSPELHNRDKTGYWESLKKFINRNQQWSELIGLCTDYPSKAREYFYD
ncbi:hypothetical protein [Agarivorans sp. Alg241-V36]|uniref:hypothetical protein n=1 Tax=Agarivorans sp. Alg241-V36 TaxID=2305992 RepID=UPI0013D82898|nr:hypothetical protein [Agarivorans sp. Alg241-V36]